MKCIVDAVICNLMPIYKVLRFVCAPNALPAKPAASITSVHCVLISVRKQKDISSRGSEELAPTSVAFPLARG